MFNFLKKARKNEHKIAGNIYSEKHHIEYDENGCLIYIFGQQVWGGRAEHGSVNVTLRSGNNEWILSVKAEDFNDHGGTSVSMGKTEKIISLASDYFDTHSADDFSQLLSHVGYYHISADEISEILPFCRQTVI